jgi:LacI family transcriptional regulator
MQHERATIYSVAESAGVSIATVSRVLKDRDAASPALRDRVLQAVEELDYVPRQSARSLAEGAHHAYGLVVGDLDGAYYPPLVIGFESTAGSSGSSVVLQVAHSQSEPALAARGLLSRVDALAIGPSALPDAAVERLARRVPVVVVGRQPIDGLDAVITENASSARALVEHLVAHGRRRLQFAGTVDGSWDAAQRFAGVEGARVAAGLPDLPPIQVAQTEEAGAALAERFAALPARERPDALLCGNDELALALVHRLRQLGVDVPGDLAVTGWDDVHAARYLTPGLTTVRQPVADLGRAAAELLGRRLTAPDAEPLIRTLATEVVVRESCGGHA